MDWRRVPPLFWPMVSFLLLLAGSTALAAWVRISIVEPEAIAQACVAANAGWRCALREFAVFGFLHNAFAATALLAGVLASIVRWRLLAALAIVAGVAGAVFYTYELSGVGLLLGALVWVRSSLRVDAHAAQMPGDQRSGEQHG